MQEVGLYDIIKSPLISEKSTKLGTNNQYVFKVEKKADKQSLKSAVEKIFAVKVRGVQTLVRKGKTKKFKGVEGRRSDCKYAIVTLEKGSELDLTGGVK